MKRAAPIILGILTLVLLAPVCQKPSSRSVRLGIAGFWPPGATKGADGSPQGGDGTAWLAGMDANADYLGVHSSYQGVQKQLDVLVKGHPYGAFIVTQLKEHLNVPDGCLACLKQNGRSLSPCTDACATSELPAYQKAIQQALDAYGDKIYAWCVGNEVESEPNLADLAVIADTLLAEAYARKPSLQGCVTFQLDRARKLADIQQRANFFTRITMLGVTAYPNLPMSAAIPGYATASAVPSDYFAQIAAWAGSRGTAVTEVGWETDLRPDGAAQQQQFYTRLTQPGFLPASTKFVSHFMLYDLGPSFAPPDPISSFKTMGLCSTATSCRPAFDVWKAARAIPYQG